MRVSGSTILSICTMSSGCCWIDPVGRGERWHHEFSPSDIKSDQNRNIKKQFWTRSGCKNATSRCKFCGFSQANDSAPRKPPEVVAPEMRGSPRRRRHILHIHIIHMIHDALGKSRSLMVESRSDRWLNPLKWAVPMPFPNATTD